MLVLTRKSAETIQIGDDIVIKVIRTGKGTVKIGVEAPAHIRVMRGELADAGIPVPSISSVYGPHVRVLSDQYPHVA